MRMRTAQLAARMAFRSVKENLITVTYNSMGQPSYNPSTGTSTRNPTPYTGVVGFFSSFDNKEIDGTQIQPTDKRLVLERQRVKFTPSLADQVIELDGTKWEVQGIQKEPTQSVWVLQLRQP